VTIEQVRGLKVGALISLYLPPSIDIYLFSFLKGGRTILGLYNESLLRALRDTFPEISFIGKGIFAFLLSSKNNLYDICR